MKSILIALIIVLGILFIGGCSIITFRNSLVNKEEVISQQWAEIENQLQRRYDLIPNLVNTVKGYAKHEESVFKSIAEARTMMYNAKGVNAKAEAEASMNSALSRLMAIAENYPNLKANENFIRLQDEISGTENRKCLSIKRYNDSVASFNKSIKMFPGCLFGFQEKSYYKIEDKAKKNIKIEF